jgi:pSer/pThr/pTyr-binding forkhead associated (FHA) protein
MIEDTHVADPIEHLDETHEEAMDDAAAATDHVDHGTDAGTGQPTLTVKRNGTETAEVFTVNNPCVIGRFDPSVGPIDIDLGNLPEGVYVSRKHAKITQEDGIWKIHDLGSSNGTFVLADDFEKVTIADLSDGSEIALGNARFIFHLS